MRSSSFCMFIVLLGVAVVAAATAVSAENNYNDKYNYADALDKTFLFFEGQRSGKLPLNQRVKWRGDSALRDGFLQGVDLVGGYYDAGDHVKFGLPAAYTVTMLAWGAIEYRKEITDLDQMGHTLWAIRWGTDYFLKAHTEPDVLWGQVGDGESDHYCWERPEDMTTPREAFKIDQYHPGSDLAAETAAAFAASSIAFKPYNSSYSNLLLLHAKQLFSFADQFRGLYDDSIKSAKQFYTSSGYSDELLWAATWLYRATNDEYYLKYVVNNAEYMGGTGWAVKEFSWDNKYGGVQVLLSRLVLEGKGVSSAYTSTLKQYKAKADYFACACVQKNGGYNVHLTPGGLMYVREWNNLQYASAAAFLLAVYSDYLSAANAKLTCPNGQVEPQELFKFSKSQADYILGKNPKSLSYLVGYGTKFPVHVHHRGSSIASIYNLHSEVGCVQGFETWYRRIAGNPNVMYGALVGGPDQNDNFSDDRSNYEQTEPTLSASAPLVGLFSKLHGSSSSTPGSGYHHKERGYNNKESTLPHQTTLASYNQETAAPNTDSGNGDKPPVEFLHSIAATWSVGEITYYKHKVVIKNISQKPITDLKLRLDNLSSSESLWGLSPAEENSNTFQLPPWLKFLKPGSECTFVYVQGGPQAKVSVLSYN